MKNKTLIAVAISLIAVVSAVSAQQIVRPVPASSITNNRVTSIFVMPIPDLSDRPTFDQVDQVIGNRGTRAWTSYFAGQQKFSLHGRAVIGADGTVVFYSNNGGSGIAFQVVNNIPAVVDLVYGGCNLSEPSTIAPRSYVATPVFTQVAALNGLPPYDWTFESYRPPAIGCL